MQMSASLAVAHLSHNASAVVAIRLRPSYIRYSSVLLPRPSGRNAPHPHYLRRPALESRHAESTPYTVTLQSTCVTHIHSRSKRTDCAT